MLAALLAVHLGVMALLATSWASSPTEHGTAALLRHTVEKRQPANLQLGDE